jgi:ribosomal protein S18 acetylase RimI-like enzyme
MSNPVTESANATADVQAGATTFAAEIPAPKPVVERWNDDESKALTCRKLEEWERRKARATTPEMALAHKYNWWSKQPVAKLEEHAVNSEPISDLLAQPLPQQRGFAGKNGTSLYNWDSEFTNEEVGGIYRLDTEQYQISYDRSYFDWWTSVGKPIRVGIRQTSNGVLAGFLIGRIVDLQIAGETQHMFEVGCIWVGPKYRCKQTANFLMDEARRRALEQGVQLGTFVNTVIVPSPCCVWDSWIRELCPERLIELFPVTQEESYEEKVKMLELRENLLVPGLRRMEEKDIDSVVELFNSYNIYSVWVVMDAARARAELLNAAVNTWVVENENGVITDLVSYIERDWTVKQPWSRQTPVVKTAHIIYQLFTGSIAMTRIFTDIMIHAKAAGVDLFEIDGTGETEIYRTNLRFTKHGYQKFLNFYNWRSEPLKPKQIGIQYP